MNDEQQPPWSIPVREPGPDVPHNSATWVDRVPLLPVVAGGLAVVVLVAAAFVVVGAETDRSAERRADDPEVLSGGVGEPDGGVAASETTTTVEEPTTTTDDPVSTTTTSTSAPQPATQRTTPPGSDPEPGDLPIVAPGVLGDGWVAQLSSVPSSAGGSALETAYATVTQTVPDAVIVRGREWPSLRPGFWVIVEPGYASGSAAVDGCVAAGKPDRDDCFGRYLMANDGTSIICYREDDGTLGGDC